MTIRTTLATAAATVLVLGGLAQAQQSQDANSAATSTGTSTSQTEMNRGVPGVDVDAGRNASGAVDVTVDRNTDSANLDRSDNASDLSSDPMRTARADRN